MIDFCGGEQCEWGQEFTVLPLFHATLAAQTMEVTRGFLSVCESGDGVKII